ncbi:hypothetical protein KIN20_035070 [Parelaphostrongylus tenuis]|uniref:Uncharacterized protein n=1 Tax=Parelaphostrongylus tenuis TaxID=148309 RepID=A0AAD5WK56_PARTN|nr:hypothetical protein KIN20_035070 [Parelaphostrongylus tenuis]
MPAEQEEGEERSQAATSAVRRLPSPALRQSPLRKLFMKSPRKRTKQSGSSSNCMLV